MGNIQPFVASCVGPNTQYILKQQGNIIKDFEVSKFTRAGKFHRIFILVVNMNIIAIYIFYLNKLNMLQVYKISLLRRMAMA